MQRETGHIHSVNADRGFLFIERSRGSNIFAHVTECDFPGIDFDARLIELPVSFSVTTNPRNGKDEAVAVKLAR